MCQNWFRWRSKIRLGSTVDRNSPELSPHAQVLSNHRHQSHAGYIDQPPGKGCWEMCIIDPTANHMKEVHSDSEIKTLLSATDEKPQTKGTEETKAGAL